MSYYIVSKMFHIGTKSYVATVTSSTRTIPVPPWHAKFANPGIQHWELFGKQTILEDKKSFQYHVIILLCTCSYFTHTSLGISLFSFFCCWISLCAYIIFFTSLPSSNTAHNFVNSPVTGVLHSDTHFSQDVWQAA